MYSPMEHLTQTILQLSSALSGSLLNAIGEGILLTAAVGICLRLLPGIKPSVRFVIWTAVLFAILPLHLLPFAAGGRPSSPPSHPGFLHLDARWGLAIIALWAIVSMVRSARLLHSAFALRRIARSAQPLSPEPALEEMLRNTARPAQLCTSTEVDRPSVVGFLHPRILLPPALLHRLSPQELEQVLLHEMEHLRRRDDWTNLIQKISLILFPLNPVLRWVERQLCIERELACDDCVLAHAATRKSYAACLTHLAEQSILNRGISLALGAWEKQSELARRVHRILRKPEGRMTPATSNIVTGGLLAGLLGGAVILAHSPMLVSFSPAAAAVVQTSSDAAIPSQTSRPVPGFSPTPAPTLVKATMPLPERGLLPMNAPRSRRGPTAHTAIKTVHRQSKPKPQNWVVLTGWRVVPISSHSTLAVSESTGSSYAAVSVEGGWLVVQL